jgi:hypothetical protein
MLRLLLERMLSGQSGLSTVGVPARIGGQDRLLFAKLTNLLSDGDGHRMGWGWKGASSLKPRWKHFNVFNRNSGLAHRKTGFVEIDCTDPALHRSLSASQVYRAVDAVAAAAGKVAAGTMSKTDFEELEMSVGINDTGHGMLLSHTLRCCATARPCGISLYDLVACTS